MLLFFQEAQLTRGHRARHAFSWYFILSKLLQLKGIRRERCWFRSNPLRMHKRATYYRNNYAKRSRVRMHARVALDIALALHCSGEAITARFCAMQCAKHNTLAVQHN